MMVFDLDPGPGVDVIECARVGLRLRKVLGGLGLESVAKTSGGKGLHLAVPLNTPGVTFEDTKAAARAIGAAMEREEPERITVSMAKHLRPGKVFIDWSQNDQHKTTVSVYSMRGRERPTVSTPVSWRELEAAVKKKDPSRLVFEIADVLARVERLGDVAEPLVKLRQRLPDVGEDAGERPAKRRKAPGVRRAGTKSR
jgi:bifunctional non-homologous end joining protein LigD